MRWFWDWGIWGSGLRREPEHQCQVPISPSLVACTRWQTRSILTDHCVLVSPVAEKHSSCVSAKATSSTKGHLVEKAETDWLYWVNFFSRVQIMILLTVYSSWLLIIWLWWSWGESITQFCQQILGLHGRLFIIRCSLSLCSTVWNCKHCQDTFSAFSRHFSSAPSRRCCSYIILGIVKYMPL